ncbi:MAG: adenylyltransferase/cytidyltransferase family protein [Vicingaceae bacterium]
MSQSEISQWIHRWRLSNRKIAFTNGVFDLLHRGHVEYLMAAADCADELIIGLNSDASVKMLNKGSSRPIQDEESRAIILASLAFVSAVVIFNEETPAKLIEFIRPDALIKGGDYQISEIAGADHVIAAGGEVKTIPLVKGYSTSSIESRIKGA